VSSTASVDTPAVGVASASTAMAFTTRFWWGVAVTTVFTALLAPFTLGAAFVALVSLDRYDTSGQGGPFRGCSADSTMCSDPNYAAAAVCVLVIILCSIGAGFGGMGVSGAGSRPAQRPGVAGTTSATAHPFARAGWQLSAFSLVSLSFIGPLIWFTLVGR
jgi:hypothetical protein